MQSIFFQGVAFTLTRHKLKIGFKEPLIASSSPKNNIGIIIILKMIS